MRMLALFLSISVLGCRPPLADDWYTCTSNAECPASFTCIAGFCRSASIDGGPSDGSSPDGARDAPGSDGGPCGNGSQDPSETDVDCGGSCPPCEPNLGCTIDGDCATQSCVGGVCVLASDPPRWVSLPAAPTLQYGAAHAEAGGLIYSIGGEGQGTFTQAYDIAAGSWRSAGVAQVPFESAGGVGVQLGNNTFAVVGNYLPVNDSYFFNGATFMTFSNAPADIFIRFYPGTVFLDGSIYAIGGCDTPGAAETPLGRVDAFAPPYDFHAWDPSPPDLMVPRCTGRAALGVDGRIYSVGGKTTTSADSTSSIVESWRPGESEWTSAASMTIPRMLFALATAPDGRIYAAGGYMNSTDATPTVEAYVPALDRWLPVASMSSSAVWAAAVVGPDGRFFVVGVGVLTYYGPAITIAPRSARAGGSVLLSGTNFAADATVDVYFGASADVTGTPVATGTTDGTGQLTTPIPVTVPAGTSAGDYHVVAIDRRSRYPVHVPLTVNP